MCSHVPLRFKVLSWAVVVTYVTAVVIYVSAVCVAFLNDKDVPFWMFLVGALITFAAYPASAVAAELTRPRVEQD